jgi:aerobic-type carbon monoxide dehydrogenase small subunit (CoxS/CutS family)
MTLTIRVNGTVRQVQASPDTPLAYVLRNELGLKGTKLGCGLEQCGACAVLVDGEPALTCSSPVETFAGREITTIEALSETETGARVQAAFVEATAAQCGYCTAGLVVAVTGLLNRTPSPSRAQIAEALTPHLCRCGAHPRVLRAVEIASGAA